ncbi:hypothetical protein Tco_0262206 [Tanacetum coccineum]
MRYTQHKRMINGDVGVKNGIFIPAREKIWWSNGIREKRKKDPYNICQERILVILECLGDALQKVLQIHTEELIQQSSQKDVSEIRQTKQESAANEKMPKDEDDLDRMFPHQPKQKKRDHGDEKDEDPSAGPNQGKKTKRRRTNESELSKKSSTSQGNSSPKTSKSDKPVHVEESSVVPTEEVIMDAANDNVVIDVDQPQDDSEPKIDKDPKNDWFKQPPRLPTLDPE